MIYSQDTLFDFDANIKQRTFFEEILKADAGLSPYRYFFYGGAIGGGKTSVCIQVINYLACKYPNMRIHIVRKDLQAMRETTIPSYFKFTPPEIIRKYNSTEEVVEFKNRSRIRFFGENYDKDKNLHRFRGLETNLIFLEQIEELQKKTFDIALQRVGRWHLEKKPKPFIICTYNPTTGWLKDEIHRKAQRGELRPPYYYLTALTKDNPYIDAEMWDNYKQLDPLSYQMMIEGDWDAIPSEGRFIFAFDPKKHVSDAIELDKNRNIFVSFDFNVDPITCIIGQHGYDYIYFLDEIRLRNSDIYDLCDELLRRYDVTDVEITGDSTGRGRNAISKGLLNFYDVIAHKFDLNLYRQLKTPATNVGIKASRVVTNSIFSRHPNVKIHPRCQYLIEDLIYVNSDREGKIDKASCKERSHLLDCLRYYIDTWIDRIVMPKIIK